jgi:hypothetical protein
MYGTGLDSVIKKFHQLWKAGFTVHLDLDAHAGKAWVGIRAQLCHPLGPEHQQIHHPFSSPSSQRGTVYQQRQERRRQAAEAAAAAKQAAQVEAEHADKAADTEARQVDKETAELAVTPFDEAGDALVASDVAVEAVDKVDGTVRDEVCSNEEYFSCIEMKKCSIQLIPVNQANIEVFRENVEKYFEERKDINESIVTCRIENAGRNVRLETIVRRQRCINLVSEPEEKYGDLPGVKRVVHDCRDLANCDRMEAWGFPPPSYHSGGFSSK